MLRIYDFFQPHENIMHSKSHYLNNFFFPFSDYNFSNLPIVKPLKLLYNLFILDDKPSILLI